MTAETLTTAATIAGPIGTIVAAGAYVLRLEGRLKVHDQMLADRDDRLNRIETKIDTIADHLIQKR